MDLSAIRMAEPAAELPGDRLLSCAQITAEMARIMEKRDMKRAAASAKGKICGSTRVLNQQGQERHKLAAAQRPGLVVASAVGGPVANAVVSKAQAEDAALEARQQPERSRALAGLGSGMGDMMGVMNDPRLMRLALLAQEKQCAESMAPGPREPLTQGESCGLVPEEANAGATAAGSDPFVQGGTVQEQPAARDPFAKR
jgi:hypothetical protein